MSKEAIKPNGFVTFKPHEKAPDFVKGTLVITLKSFNEWCKNNQQYLTEYKGEKQIKLKVTEGKYGLNFEVDTWGLDKVSEPAQAQTEDDDSENPLPF